MKKYIPVLLGILLLAGCGGGDNSDNVAVVDPPPVDPGPVDPPPTMQSFANFTRVVYADDANEAPREINDLSFNQDAADDDFSDLLQ
tara:strand:+ start:41848 stop:42108 length:261 start_codon:yes stop_codon:yes gene_type:complete